MDEEIEKQLEAEARNNVYNDKNLKIDDEVYTFLKKKHFFSILEFKILLFLVRK